MRKITLNTILFFSLGFISFMANSQTSFYYEDFRYENEGRGFTIQIVTNVGQTVADIGKRVGDIPDASDTDPIFTSRPADRIPEGSTRDQRSISFKNVTGSPADTNHEIEAWALMTSQDLTSINAPSVSFRTQQRYAIGGNSSLTIWVSTNYTHGNAPNTATWTDETSNITGEIATAGLKGETFVLGELDLSSYTSSSNVTVAFKNVSDNSTFVSDVNTHGTFYVADVIFQLTPVDVIPGSITLNTNGSGQTAIFDEPYASSGDNNTNFNPKYFDRLFALESYSTRFISGQTIPVEEGPVFKVSDAYNPVIISEFKYTVRNAAKSGVDPTSWKIEASNDQASWTDVGGGAFTPTQDSASDAAEQIRAVNTSNVPYRYYRMVLASELTAANNTGFIEFQEANFTTIEATANTISEKLNTKITIYPNPVSSILNIQESSVESIRSIRLIDMTGKTIFEDKYRKSIDVSNFKKGIYILQLTLSNGKISSERIVIN